MQSSNNSFSILIKNSPVLGLTLGGFHEPLGVKDRRSLNEAVDSFLKYHLSLIRLAKSSKSLFNFGSLILF